MEDLRHANQEQMKLLLLNTKSRLCGETDISKGTVNSAVISPRELFGGGTAEECSVHCAFA